MSNLIPMPKETLNRCRNMALNLLLELDDIVQQKYTMKIQVSYSNSQEFAKMTQVYISYYTYSLFHDLYQDEHGQWIQDHDTEYKGYCFSTDYNWRFPVPNPSEFEILPVPDFTQEEQMPIVVQNCTLSAGRTYFMITFTNPETVVEIRNLPCGVYNINVTPTNEMKNIQYYPSYYNDYPSTHSVSRGQVMIDRSGNLSGFSYINLYNSVSPYQPTGYDFYCISDKFANNIVEVVGERKSHLKFVFKWIDIPRLTGERFVSRTNSDVRYYLYVSNTNPNSTMIISPGYVEYQTTEIPGKMLGVEIYEDNEYKGCGALRSFVVRSIQQSRPTFDSVIAYGVPCYIYNDSIRQDNVYHYVSIAYLYEGESIKTYNGSTYTPMSQGTLQNSDFGYCPDTQYISVYPNDCRWDDFQNRGEHLTNSSWYDQSSEYYNGTFYEKEAKRVQRTIYDNCVKNNSYVEYDRIDVYTYSNKAYRQDMTHISSVSNEPNWAVGGYVEPTVTHSSTTHTRSNPYLVAQSTGGILWDGTFPTIGTEQTYYYTSGITRPELINYLSRFGESEDFITVEFDLN